MEMVRRLPNDVWSAMACRADRCLAGRAEGDVRDTCARCEVLMQCKAIRHGSRGAIQAIL